MPAFSSRDRRVLLAADKRPRARRSSNASRVRLLNVSCVDCSSMRAALEARSRASGEEARFPSPTPFFPTYHESKINYIILKYSNGIYSPIQVSTGSGVDLCLESGASSLEAWLAYSGVALGSKEGVV